MTITLLLNSEGKKMGKTASGAVWLDPNKTTPYEFYQYWRNVGDGDVMKCLRMLTFLPLDEINAMEPWMGTSRVNEAKEILAFELTKLVHGEVEATAAQNAARAIFSAGDASDMPTVTVAESDLLDGAMDILSLLVRAALVPSRSEARRAVEQGGVSVNGEKVTDTRASFNAEALRAGVVLRRGKKSYKKVELA